MKSRTLASSLALALGALVAREASAQGAPGAPPAPAAPARAAPTTPVVAPGAPGAPVGAVPGAPVAPGAAAAVAPGGADTGVMVDRPLPDRGARALEGVEPEPNGLTANEVARRALAVSPSVKQKRAQVDAANEKITQTMLQFFPRLTVNAGYTRLSNVTVSFGSGALVGAQSAGPLQTGAGGTVLDSAGNPVVAVPVVIPTVVDNWSVGARLSVPLSDYVLRLSDAAASSKASKQSAKYAAEAEKLKVQSDARVLYFNWLRSRAQVSIAKNAVERTKARLSDARSTFAVGAISKADLLRIEALVANTELVLDRAESFQLLTSGQLAIVMEDWHPNYRVGEGIPMPADIADPKVPLERLIAGAQERRLEVHTVDEAARGFTRGAAATRGGALPRVEAVGDALYANPNQRYFPPQNAWHGTWSVGVQASWTIGDSFSNSAAARELEANAAATAAQRTALRAGIAQEVLASYLDLGRARDALDKQRAALAAAEEGYRVTTDLFRAGRATSTDLIEAESQLLEAKLGDVNARIDLTIASLSLRHATAEDVPGRATANE